MKTKLVVYANSDDALLMWSADTLDDRLEGFAIQRQLKRGRARPRTTWLDNYAPPGIKAYQNGDHQPSDRRPFRTFTWTDHGVEPGDRVRYRVVPFLGGTTAPSQRLASDWSRTKTLGWRKNARYRAFFNRGFVISQFMSRYLDQHYPGLDRVAALRKFKSEITSSLEDAIRVFLSGEVRTHLLALLDEVARSKREIYAALFELSDEELIEHLLPIGARAHVVLANGSVQQRWSSTTHKPLETLEEARAHDENAAARRRLLDAGIDVETSNRFVSPSPLAHNKFLVVVDWRGRPLSVWTGSTNWTTTGLCTQLNNALLVHDEPVARAYLQQWHALRAAGSTHPSTLADANATPNVVGAPAARVHASIHFTRTSDRVDLDALRDVVQSAKQGVLFLMFIPGSAGLLKDVRALPSERPNLLVRGVVSELPEGRPSERSGPTTPLKVTLIGSGTPNLDGTRTFDVVQPEGRAHPTAWWAEETTHSQFLSGIGHAIVHSKVVVVDPFSDQPRVVTGSHNFSISASEDNDENFIVVRGHHALAEAYAVNVESAWRHYASRAGVPHPGVFGVAYLRALLDDQRREEPFWRLA